MNLLQLKPNLLTPQIVYSGWYKWTKGCKGMWWGWIVSMHTFAWYLPSSWGSIHDWNIAQYTQGMPIHYRVWPHCGRGPCEPVRYERVEVQSTVLCTTEEDPIGAKMKLEMVYHMLYMHTHEFILFASEVYVPTTNSLHICSLTINQLHQKSTIEHSNVATTTRN